MNKQRHVSLYAVGLLAALGAGCQDALDADESDSLAQLDPNIDAGIDAIDAGSADAGDELDPDAGDVGSEVDAAKPKPVEPPITLLPTDSPYIAEVKANGTGCRAGSWNTSISPKGDTFTTTFSEYFAEVTDGKRSSFKDCNLTVRMRSPDGLSFAVSDFYLQGYAYLEAGVRAFQTANYYFQGNPVPSVDKEKRTDLTGPVDRSYLFQDTVRTTDALWSPCGLDRNLQIVTRIGVQKSQLEGSGYINLDKVVRFKLAWRRCDAPASQPRPTPSQPASK